MVAELTRISIINSRDCIRQQQQLRLACWHGIPSSSLSKALIGFWMAKLPPWQWMHLCPLVIVPWQVLRLDNNHQPSINCAPCCIQYTTGHSQMTITNHNHLPAVFCTTEMFVITAAQRQGFNSLGALDTGCPANQPSKTAQLLASLVLGTRIPGICPSFWANYFIS